MSLLQVYLFYIKTNSAKEYYLTSGNNSIIHAGKIYLPYSGLSLVSGNFNDSAENHIILHGIFEENGITKNDSFVDSSIKIMRFQGDQVRHFVTYICTQHNIDDLEFEIRLEPETIKYNQSLLQMFSKSCRADFGDNMCKINKADYSVTYELIGAKGNMLNCNIQNIENGYYTGGTLITNDQQELLILAHHNNNIEIESIPECDLHMQEHVTLIPTCDKFFRTCCYSFNNAVNFRGEPAIPESNIVKN